MNQAVRIEGVPELRRALDRLDPIENRKEIKAGIKSALGVVARDAQGRVPSKTGRSRKSIRVTTTGNRAYVVGGSATVRHYGWLDFGSRTPITGNPRSKGPWAGSGKGPHNGRFIYPAFTAKDHQVVDLIEKAVQKALNSLDL